MEGEFGELDGWTAESDAEILLNGLGITNEFHYAKMKELTGNQKVKVLLAQALFGNPDILLLDEPTNHLDLESITAVNDGLKSFKGSIIFTSYDFEFINTIANRVIDLNPTGGLSKETTYRAYLEETGVLK